MTWNTLPISSYFIPDAKRLAAAASTTEPNKNSSSARRQSTENETIPFHIDRSESHEEECPKTPIKIEATEDISLVTPHKDEKKVPAVMNPTNCKKQKL